jgi:cellulose synthase/poly-beta-1,6-N-acetylglucosamine synthase-like glycosyltransferase
MIRNTKSSELKKNPTVSIIIPCKEIDYYTIECINHCKKLDYDNYEIIVLPDNYNTSNQNIEGVIIIPTGNVTPGKKRNIGIKHAKGEICAFIDSDARPEKNWLKNALLYLTDPEVAAVGGPGLTPPEDSPMQKASGYVLSSFMVAGLSSRYKASGKPREVDDIHSCNFIAKKPVLEKIGGWNEKYWPGEDTLLCAEIKKLGMKIIYAPNVIVYHHRKPLYKEHLKQISRYGLHRGFFAKKYPENSMKITYFLPALLVISLIIGGILSYFSPLFKTLFLGALTSYLALALISAVQPKDIRLMFPILIGIILTHLIYGIYFIIGLTKRELKI